MTLKLIPFRETQKPNQSLHVGPYYGHALRKIIDTPAQRGGHFRDVHSTPCDAAPGLPAASIIERESAHPWRWVALAAFFFAAMCGGLFVPPAAQFAIAVILTVMAGAVLGLAVRL